MPETVIILSIWLAIGLVFTKIEISRNDEKYRKVIETEASDAEMVVIVIAVTISVLIAALFWPRIAWKMLKRLR